MIGRKKFLFGIFKVTLSIFVLAISLYFVKDNAWAVGCIIALGLLIYIDIFIKINVGVKKITDDKPTLKDLKFLLFSLITMYAAAYFFISIIDVDEELISGIRMIKLEGEYDFSSCNDWVEYISDIVKTYFNSLYYSVVVMVTLGDSSIIIKGYIVRFFVVAEVLSVLFVTLFKVTEYYDNISKNKHEDLKRVIKRLVDDEVSAKGSMVCDNTQGIISKIIRALNKKRYLFKR